MANDVETEARPSLTHLVGGIVQDAQQLARQQLTLFQVELKNDIRRTARGAIPLVAGIFVCLIGASAAALAVAHLLPTIWPRLPLWGGLAIVGGTLIGLGAVLVVVGRRYLAGFNPPPVETVQGLKENIQWMTNK